MQRVGVLHMTPLEALRTAGPPNAKQSTASDAQSRESELIVTLGSNSKSAGAGPSNISQILIQSAGLRLHIRPSSSSRPFCKKTTKSRKPKLVSTTARTCGTYYSIGCDRLGVHRCPSPAARSKGGCALRRRFPSTRDVQREGSR